MIVFVKTKFSCYCHKFEVQQIPVSKIPCALSANILLVIADAFSRSMKNLLNKYGPTSSLTPLKCV